ncbi:hypothetical protein [Spiroplasma endosymbiont of Apeira syringaria]|uniref:hypothetical protein n=1 Tax=Spiroplasma endosymbiont of Apeira syringaria TaxID=3066307 RepID=UPI0030CB0A32
MADAIRGCSQLLEINSCNPWSILNYYIKNVVTYCPQNEKQIINEYEQFYFNEKERLFNNLCIFVLQSY